MVRAILKNGVIQPLGPLPDDWAEGQTLRVESEASPADNAAMEAWDREVESASARVSLEDHQAVQRAIEEHRREQKALMRRRMEQS